MVSAAVLLIVLYSTRWLERNKRLRGQNAHVIARSDALRHCFEKSYFTTDATPLFPVTWAAFGASRQPPAVRRRLGRLFAANYVSAIVLLGILAVIMIWLPG